jgi:hypothetical protein
VKIDPLAQDPLDRLPRWVPAALYALLTFIAYRTYLLSPPGSMLVGNDTITAGVMLRTFFTESVRALGRVPQWNPYMMGGVPYVEGGGGDVFYPSVILHFLLPMTTALAWKLIIHVFLAGVFMYLCARAFGASRWVALLIGAAHLVSAQLISQTHDGQDTKLYVTAIFPGALWLLVTAIEKLSLARFLWLGVIAGCMLLGHPQLSFYGWLALGGIGLGMIWVRRTEGTKPTLLRVGGGLVSVAVALGVASAVLWPMYEYLQHYSTRGGGGFGIDWSSSYGFHWPETVGMLIAGFAGTDANQQTYWSLNPFKGNLEYAGGIIFALGVGSLWALKGDRRRWGLLAVALIAWFNAMGTDTPVYQLLYAAVKQIRNFRAPSLSMFLVFISFSVLAAMGLQRAFGGEGDPRARKILARSLAIGAGVAGLFFILMISGGAATVQSLLGVSHASRAPLLARSIPAIAGACAFSAIFLLAAWGAFALNGAGALPVRGVIVALLALTVIDGLRVDDRFVEAQPFVRFFPDDPMLTELRSRLAPGERVYAENPDFPSGKLASYHIPDVFGYHANQLKWYDTFTRRFEREADATGRSTFEMMLSPAFKALSVRFMILPPVNVPITGWELLGQNQRTSVWRSTGALAGAAVISNLVVEPDTAKQVDALWTQGFDVSTTAIVSAPVAGIPAGKAGKGTFSITGFAPDTIAATVTTDGPAFFLLSQNWHPYWQAEVDGQRADIVRADYTLQGVVIPAAGAHKVVFRYRSPRVAQGFAIAKTTWSLVLILSLALAFQAWRRRPTGG